MNGQSSTLAEIPLHGKRVFIRADLNVPHKNDTITNDFRLQALLPTLQYVKEQNASIILATHIGRPGGKYNPRLSTKLLIPWLKQHGFHVIFEEKGHALQQSNKLASGSILLLENLRFNLGEKSNNTAFAQHLASLADVYVNDAFATLHRNDASITSIPTYFSQQQKTIGFLVEKELKNLTPMLTTVSHPYAVILGGGKVTSKLPLIEGLLSQIDTLVLCPALVFTFLKAIGKEIGHSRIDSDAVSTCQNLMQTAKKHTVTILFPRDFQITYNITRPEAGPFTYYTGDHIPKNALGISIGPKTIHAFSKALASHNTIFFNAAMGFSTAPETLSGTYTFLHKIAHMAAFTVVGGGSSVAAVYKQGLAEYISFLSTGGGATLTYISGQSLPGLQALTRET